MGKIKRGIFAKNNIKNKVRQNKVRKNRTKYV